jgi:hypothetical protein
MALRNVTTIVTVVKIVSIIVAVEFSPLNAVTSSDNVRRERGILVLPWTGKEDEKDEVVLLGVLLLEMAGRRASSMT